MGRRPSHTYPFTAIVGQETLKTALLLNAIDPLVGGVLIRGEKGTAKSTAVRALAAVLPEHDIVDACRFACDPSDPGSWCEECRERREDGPLPRSSARPRVVDLPVSATEDRLIGTLDLEHALKHGTRVFEPGLLAEANRSILYVDEVNLLDDHLVDTLLDAAAMGVNVVQREGISFTHPARFILVGTMNPEEGEVRPQLLDRFGLCVDVTSERDMTSRVEIVKRRRSFENGATEFCRIWVDAEDELQVTLKHARLRLPTVELPDQLLHRIADLCSRAGVDGHRADLTMARAAVASAAFAGRSAASVADVRYVAPLVLAHRMRRTPFHDQEQDLRMLNEAMSSALGPAETAEGGAAPDGDSAADGLGAAAIGLASCAEEVLAARVEAPLEASLDRARRSIAGRRQETLSGDSRGRYSRSEPAPACGSGDLALDATIRAAAPHQNSRIGDMAIEVRPDDVHQKIRTRKVGTSIVFCVDGSGSMGAQNRMDAARGAVLELLIDAYRRRDRVGLVTFRGNGADVVLAPTSSVELAQIKLKQLPTGGATPLAHGMVKSLELLTAEARRDQRIVPWLVLVTDGRANVGLDGGLGSEDARAIAARLRAADLNVLLIDTSGGSRPSSAARELALAAGAQYVRLESVAAGAVANAVRERIV